MKQKNTDKTNVCRVLDQQRLEYQFHSYAHTEAISADEVAKVLGQDPSHVFKTLVTVGHSKKNYVFVVPATGSLDLKKAAKAVGEKSIEMIMQKDLLPLTGYIHGGCSPIGMKKLFTTTVDKSAQNCETICISAGKIGFQVEIRPEDLAKAVPLKFEDIVTE